VSKDFDEVRFWAAEDLVLLLDAAMEPIMRQLSDIKAVLKRPTQWPAVGCTAQKYSSQPDQVVPC
jgi:hypothetical protein